MNRWLRGALATVVVTAGGLATAWLSQAPWQVPEAERALLRLAWSGRPERIEHCRALSDEELERVPAHMRQRVRCEGASARYLLEVTVPGVAGLVDTLVGGGARRDRPIHLLRDLSLDPGSHRIAVSLRRIDSLPEASLDQAAAPSGTAMSREREEREGQERERARHEALPPVLELEADLRLDPGDVALVTFDPDSRRLVVRSRRRQ